MKPVKDLPSFVVATTSPSMALALLDALARLTKDDIESAITRNSEYRERAAVQWAVMAAHRAREFFPEYKRED